MPKIKEYGPPADLLSRLPTRTIVTKGDKLAAFDALLHRADISWRAARVKIFEAIRADIRASGRPQRDSAPAQTGAPSKASSSTEVGSSIPASVLERKIDTPPHGILQVRIDVDTSQLIITHESICALVLTPDQADQFAQALAELADDLRQDAAARAWSQQLLEATTE